MAAFKQAAQYVLSSVLLFLCFALSAAAQTTCPQPASPGVNICSPVAGSTVTSPFTISASGRNTNGTAGLDVWLDGQKVGWYPSSSITIQVSAANGSHQLDIYSVGVDNELQLRSVVFAVGTTSGAGCAAPSTPGVNICSPLNGSSVSSPVTISAAGRNNGNTAGLDVWIDGVKLGWYPGTNVNTQAPLASGTHQLDIYAVGTNGELQSKTSIFTVASSGGGGPAAAIKHVVFMMQENRSFDNYFGMLNPYRQANGWSVGANGQTYRVDGLDGSKAKVVNFNDEGVAYAPFKLATSCIDDISSAWLESYGDVNRWDFSPSRGIFMDGFVHISEGYAKGAGLGDVSGKRTMGYYDSAFLNYYYFMASQFALSDRWFSPVSAKTVPNRIATMTGGTTQGLVRDPSTDDHLGQLSIPTIFEKLDGAGVSWKIYYTALEANGMPGTSFSYFTFSNRYLYSNPTHAACTGTTQPSSVVGDGSNGFCVDPNRIAPLSQYYRDAQNGTLPSFAYIEPGYEDGTDEHPGIDVIRGQQRVADIINNLMNSVSWKDSVFFLAYDEGGPFDHVPPVPGQTNKFTDASLGITTDISSIAVNADSYKPCPLVSGSFHCDLRSFGSYADPGYVSSDAPAQQGFAAQLGFRVPNMVISPFVRKHYVSHAPMDHTAVIKFVESRFIGSTAHLTARDAAQPDLLDFFDFTNAPWANPPAAPTPSAANACNPTNLNPAP